MKAQQPLEKINWSKVHNQFIEQAKPFKKLSSAIIANGPITLDSPKEKDLFVFLCRIIVGQQLSTHVAQTIWSRILKLCNDKTERLMNLCSASSAAKLRECGLSARKVEALLRLQKSFKEGEIDQSRIQQLQDEEVVDEISRIWGLGPWSAEMVLIGFLGRTDVWSENDGSLKRGINLALGGVKSSHKVVELFKPYRTLLSRHIWKALDDGILTG
tara:strand:+ start:894 stop:1538 length:645 start_codon:yes stop_codon:yes gene_type:complete